MGKAMRLLRALLGIKRDKNADHISCLPADAEKKEKNRCSFDRHRSYPAQEDRNEHAIAVAAASAAAADAAVAAAQAAVAVVVLTNQTRGGGLFNGGKVISAALTIQKVFRGFLARKALQALRSLVKLQALVRGFLVRKRAAATLQSMQALIRAQTTVRSQRARRSNNKENKSLLEKSPDGDIGDVRFLFPDEIEDPKIVEIDKLFQKPKSRSRHFNNLLSELADDRPSPYLWTMASPARFSGGEWCFTGGEECGRLSTAQSTPRVRNYGWTAAATATPARRVYGEGFFRPYTNFPNYMASTKSFKAKSRSRSAPKQRAEGWTKNRVALNEIMGGRNSTSGVRMQKCCNRIEGDEGFDEF